MYEEGIQHNLEKETNQNITSTTPKLMHYSNPIFQKEYWNISNNIGLETKIPCKAKNQIRNESEIYKNVATCANKTRQPKLLEFYSVKTQLELDS